MLKLWKIQTHELKYLTLTNKQVIFNWMIIYEEVIVSNYKSR